MGLLSACITDHSTLEVRPAGRSMANPVATDPSRMAQANTLLTGILQDYLLRGGSGRQGTPVLCAPHTRVRAALSTVQRAPVLSAPCSRIQGMQVPACKRHRALVRAMKQRKPGRCMSSCGACSARRCGLHLGRAPLVQPVQEIVQARHHPHRHPALICKQPLALGAQ